MRPSWYVVDWHHDPRPEAATDEVPREALRLWDYFAAIVESGTATWGGLQPRITAVPCRRRPGRRPCGAFLAVGPRPEGGLEWTCPRCEDGGVFLEWSGSPADLSRVAVPGEHQADPQAWRAAIVTPTEHRLLVETDPEMPAVARRILRAARATRPGIRIEAPVAAWDVLLDAAARTCKTASGRAARRDLRAAHARLVDATRAWAPE